MTVRGVFRRLRAQKNKKKNAVNPEPFAAFSAYLPLCVAFLKVYGVFYSVCPTLRCVWGSKVWHRRWVELGSGASMGGTEEPLLFHQ